MRNGCRVEQAPIHRQLWEQGHQLNCYGVRQSDFSSFKAKTVSYSICKYCT
uniref:Uncharacterized protein n=1 Tax=Picea sitchensis TaxID=3332 RepID=A9NYN3_PICSI|nr:unknown [Picea sitchensis]